MQDNSEAIMRARLLSQTLVNVLILGSAVLQLACSSSQDVTVYMVDGTKDIGPLVGVSDTSVTLSPLRLLAPDLGNGVYRILPRSFPIPQIEHVTLWIGRTDPDYTTSRSINGIWVGFLAGAAAAELVLGLIGGIDMIYPPVFVPFDLVGGALGAWYGAMVSGPMIIDTIGFDPKIPVQRDSLRLYIREN
jgi:hypothetical protein